MKKIFNIKNIGLLVIIVLITVLTMNTKEAKAAGTVTWSGPSSITIRETIHNIAGPIVAHRDYNLVENFGDYDEETTATINYTASDTPTNYQITKSTTMNLSNITFVKPGDYTYAIGSRELIDSNYNILNDYVDAIDGAEYDIAVSVRNILDANNTPTGNFTASLVLLKSEYNEQSDDLETEKVNPVSGVLYADFDYETNPEGFGHIEVSKTVKGIGADTTKYFPFTITINNDATTTNKGYYPLDSSGWTYLISGIDSTVTYNGNTVTNPTTITNGTPTTIYLKHGQTAMIGQATNGGSTFDTIPIGECNHGEGSPKSFDNNKSIKVKKLAYIPGDDEYWMCYGSYYTVEENPDDYTATFSVNNGGVDNGYNISYFGVNDGSNTVDFYNQKEMSPVTGLIFTILPYLILAGIGIGGTLLVIHLKKEEKKVS